MRRINVLHKNQTPSKRDKQNSESLMKTHIKNLFTRLGGVSCVAWVLPALIAGLGLIPAGRVTAQTFTTLHSFTLPNNNTNSDGAIPLAGLIVSDYTFMGRRMMAAVRVLARGLLARCQSEHQWHGFYKFAQVTKR